MLPPGWVAQMTRAHIPTDYRENPHSANGYGFQVWRGLEGFRLDGAGGQYVLVMPERDAVVAITAGHAPTQIILDLVHNLLVPALGRESAGGPTTLEGLEVPIVAGGAPTREVAYAGVPRVVDRSVAGIPWQYPTVRDPRLADGTLTFASDDGPVEIGCGAATWQESVVAFGDAGEVRVAARAVEAADQLVVDLAFIETPFRLTLRLRADGDAIQTWNTAIVHSDGFSGLGASARTAHR
ncbi:hypothetical protein GCM10027418_21410 [Mariniluteicoccus endophyticus]